jgi:hypothetical protein
MVENSKIEVKQFHYLGLVSRLFQFGRKQRQKQALDADYLNALKPHLMAPSFALLLFIRTIDRRTGEAVSIKPADFDLIKGTVYIGKIKKLTPRTQVLFPHSSTSCENLSHAMLVCLVALVTRACTNR